MIKKILLFCFVCFSFPALAAPFDIVQSANTIIADIAKGNYAAADTVLNTVAAQSDIKGFHNYPLNDVVAGVISRRDRQNFPQHMSQWVAASPQSPWPYVLRGDAETAQAWHIRGDGFFNSLTSDQFNAFHQGMETAEKEYSLAISLNDAIPYFWQRKLDALGHASDHDLSAVDDFMHAAMAKFPTYYGLYITRLEQLKPKWGGSVNDMTSFVETVLPNQPADSPVRFLGIDLYEAIAGDIIIQEGNGSGGLDAANTVAYRLDAVLRAPQTVQAIDDALKLSQKMDAYAYNQHFMETMNRINTSLGMEPLAALILKRAELIMKNNYAYDYAIGNSGTVSEDEGRYPGAIASFKKAVQEAEVFSYPDKFSHDAALAEIYQGAAHAQEMPDQYDDAVLSIGKSLALGPNDEKTMTYACRIYMEHKDYEKSIAVCSKLIEKDPGNGGAYFWRGWSYQDTGHLREAKADYEAAMPRVRDYLRRRVILALASLYVDQHDLQGSIDVFENNPMIFDAAADRINAEKAYNNVCYAYMEMHQDEKALENCNKAIALGGSSQAREKQRQLLARLGKASPLQKFMGWLGF